MDANVYFDAMYFELNFLETRINDVIRTIEKTPCPNKAKVTPQLPRLRFLAAHLTKRIEQLLRENPIDWRATLGEIESQEEWPEGPFYPAYTDLSATESFLASYPQP